MQIESHIETLREDLDRLAAVGDDSTARAAELLTLALESAFARRMQEALAEAALELSGQLEHGRVEVRIAGSDPELVYVDESQSSAPDQTESAYDARISLRLPESLKRRLEAAANASGVSANTWLVQTLNRQLLPRPAGGVGRHRLSGFGRS